ncbi:hypothetical protein TNCV_1402791 [Trichonephila clavipes]|nr:hypothetical protein TNCV_1402791 [Trichonephila clavipes]
MCDARNYMRSIFFCKSHCSSKAVENVARALEERLRAATRYPRALKTCSISTKSSPIAPRHKGSHKYQDVISRGVIVNISTGKNMCVHPKRYHSKHRHCLIRMHLFHGRIMDEHEFRFFPIKNTPTITFEAKPELILKEIRPPLIKRHYTASHTKCNTLKEASKPYEIYVIHWRR